MDDLYVFALLLISYPYLELVQDDTVTISARSLPASRFKPDIFGRSSTLERSDKLLDFERFRQIRAYTLEVMHIALDTSHPP